ncbi:lipocalin-like domain-containing protein [Mameliella sediminis]|uniref:lipocalin-like domain-containing protein n=1 Tax=Mameliella sediminis TaxID=2836866 RepID=UPI001C45D934|nr:lipocalin-like domain-containing protein [Mameliella sediminis]MBV7393138.1 lipocalin-like domain-containing protein [Mameliella sediminis]
MADAQDLIGSWRMVSWTRQALATGAVTDAQGPNPLGYIAYHGDGRMMATVFQRNRPVRDSARWSTEQKAELFDTMLAYVAAYTLDGDKIIHHVEGAWNPDWEIDLTRPFTLSGTRLVISGAPGVDPVTGEQVIYRMEFEKV